MPRLMGQEMQQAQRQNQRTQVQTDRQHRGMSGSDDYASSTQARERGIYDRCPMLPYEKTACFTYSTICIVHDVFADFAIESSHRTGL